jgi:hypothetical protein
MRPKRRKECKQALCVREEGRRGKKAKRSSHTKWLGFRKFQFVWENKNYRFFFNRFLSGPTLSAHF